MTRVIAAVTGGSSGIPRITRYSIEGRIHHLKPADRTDLTLSLRSRRQLLP